ncbi:Methyltransferase type 12 [Rhodomicrobium vannielii ATCC 17100]|uniref:Methyltransferase type 12 n=1 Tax=Rhodomicrobium vannielii (strain ATCC 17100 / DSM 162 / LMG 4299 / NCIMB 10020 / ATH 3.1.1) TaxID=648757 RepID=E3I581_RHOVT|nr:methyltransferase domain-containing protein [Rhodomicrobium vannielii]ADP70531.1 Methyltransferase type 12 [Rhodomicrobium vannielii ATCC 17100]
MSDSNRETLRSYDARVRNYVAGTAQTVSGEAKDWIDAALSGLPDTARILELGSAFGRDAAYIASNGFEIECTDAVPGFLAELKAKGLAARHFNVLTDELTDRYDLILANAVLLHFARHEFTYVLKKMARSLKDGGRFAFSLKKGQGESWSSEKIGAPRFFCYWERQDLEPLLADAGFASWSVSEARTSRAHAEWLFIIAFAPRSYL